MPLVHFRVRCETAFGERLLVVGSSLSTGAWRPENSQVELSTDPLAYPVWTATCSFLEGAELLYKFVVIEGGSERWEDDIGNRKCVVGRVNLEVTAAFNCRDTVVGPLARPIEPPLRPPIGAPAEAVSTVRFKLRCDTKLGEEVRVVGSCEAVGSWDPRRSQAKLSTSKCAYPWWTGSVDCRRGSLLEYKFVVFSASGTQWEDRPNRMILIGDADMEIHAVFTSEQTKTAGPSLAGLLLGDDACEQKPGQELPVRRDSDESAFPPGREALQGIPQLPETLERLTRAEPKGAESHQLQPGDFVTLGPDAPLEHGGEPAVVKELIGDHGTLMVLDATRSYGIAECRSALGALRLESDFLRLGRRVSLDGLRGARAARLNGLTGAICRHPQEGHPAFVRTATTPDRLYLAVAVRLDEPPSHVEKIVLIEPRYLVPGGGCT